MTEKRFLQLPDVADTLDISMSQIYALVRRGDLRAIKIGGRGSWRVEVTELEDYIRRCYAETDAAVAAGGVDPDRTGLTARTPADGADPR